MDYDEEFDRDEDRDEQEFLPEYGWWKRAAPMSELPTMVVREKFSVTDPVQRFLLYCSGAAKQLIDAKVVKFGVNDIDEMLKIAKTVKNAAYKNPTAFVLAYDAFTNSNENESIQREYANALWTRAVQADFTTNVTKIDLVRYVRLLNAKRYL